MPAKSLCVQVPASCGEVIEAYTDCHYLLSSYQVNCYTTHELTPFDPDQRPSYPEKVTQFLKLLQAKYHLIDLPQIKITNDIPIGKGLASSTADLFAVALGLNEWYQLNLEAETILKLCCRVEPSDNQMFGSLALIDFIQGQILLQPPFKLNCHILCLEPEQVIPSHIFYENLPARDSKSYNQLLEDFYQVCHSKDQNNLDDLAQVAARSALINQNYLPKPLLPELLDIVHQTPGVLGLNIAHSGSIIALWFDDQMIPFADLSLTIRQLDSAQYYSKHHHWQTVQTNYSIYWSDL